MRKWSLLLLGVGLAALAATVLSASGSAALNRALPLNAAIPTCTTTSATVSVSGLGLARGNCHLGGRLVASRLMIRYSSADSGGYSCGVTNSAVRGTRFQLGPAGLATATGSAYFVPKVKRPYKSRAMRFSYTGSGDPALQCGKPATPTVNLCDKSQWPPYGWPASDSEGCGIPVSNGCAFASLPSVSPSGILTIGHVSCKSQVCRLGLDTVSYSGGAGPYDDGVGGKFYFYRLLCSDGIGVEVSTSFEIANQSGAICPYNGNGSWTVNLPTRFNGTLYLISGLVVWPNWAKHNPNNVDQVLGRTSETVRIQLTGSTPPC